VKTYKYAREALNTIEKLCMIWENGPKTKKQAQLIFDEIFRYSHLFSNCANPHVNWRQELKKAKEDYKNYETLYTIKKTQ
jgi:hypothetical protein